ncbi:MAG: DUF3280 domain-containing protein [Roseovarius sp.]
MRLITLIFLGLASTAAAGDRTAFFGITYLDDSLQGETRGIDPAETARLDMLHEMVTDRFTAEGYDLVDTTPVQTELDRIMNPAKCHGCDTRMATRLGADMSLVGEVQKVSNLIIAMNLQLRDAQTGDMVRGGVVDIRANTDDAWRRGMRYILDNRIFREAP